MVEEIKSHLFTIFIFSFILLGCKGPEGPTGSTGSIGATGQTGKSGGGIDTLIYNKWQMISGGSVFDNSIKYLDINNDKNVYTLSQDITYDFKNYRSDFALITESQIMFNSQVYNYSISENTDTLKFSIPNYVPAIFIKNNSSPIYSQWIPSIFSQDSLISPYPLNGDGSGTNGVPLVDLGFDGTNLRMGGDKIYKIDPVTHNVISTLPLSCNSVEYALGYLWIGNGTILSKIDSNGTTLQTSPQMSANSVFFNGLAWDGQYFWCKGATGMINYDSLYKYDPLSNQFVSAMAIPWFSGMAYANGYFYICRNGYVDKCTMMPLKSIATYKINSAESWGYGGTIGIAFDGSSFWVLIESKYTRKIEIHKIFLN